jgi:predicted  nucleic acid-binding Zn-ribbon protein
MAITRQLYHLQELDLEIESQEKALSQKTGQLGDRSILDSAQERLASEQKQLDDLRHRHRDAEAEVDDLLSKIATAEGQLYGGKISNPKELSSLQHEVTTMKARSDELENRALDVIDQVEAQEKVVDELTSEHRNLQDDWHRQQQFLADEIEQLKESLADLKQRRQQLSGQIDSSAISLYERIRQQKKQAVAKVEQGICRACRISLSASALQKARSGQPVQCGTCGRILFIS